MQQELRFATFNVCNLALPGVKFYDDVLPYTVEEYEAKTTWLAAQIDRLDADVIGFQEIFSQAALKDVLAKTRNYRQATLTGQELAPVSGRLTPGVALVSRLPLAGTPVSYTDFPRQLRVPLPDGGSASNRFMRPVLHAQIAVNSELVINVFVVHLKSKRPDYHEGEYESDSGQFGMATLRSLIRRGAEALGLRYLLTDLASGGRIPLMVLGDFNDVAGSVSSQLVMGNGRPPAQGFDDRLFDSYRLQTQRDPLRDLGYSSRHDNRYETIDHILVSEEFNPASRYALGEVLEVLYRNDHLALMPPQASDHGQVVARIRLYGAGAAD
jgi:endonuclease/exonuclease/phosphatase family metal-dependent hydrolase